MIEKIQNLIEDNTSMEVTRNQVIMGLIAIGLLLALVVLFMFGMGKPKVDKNYKSVPPIDAPVYTGQ